ncbi:rhomboid family intramembrane serine protease [Corynebacterium guangdongense]|uniref:Membrane associated rhomboid family serine protease n=1 Tax=Corynebacterium guangdongense TaxID=1783348 RepID=A0ABU2A0B9_9CORY|nr:rhomboid family intramembrane serine protease [Corynebacterium guangdongense]MDR7330624.1 membrane associated rhomboid family serine protease [Corynebacterium guangdongense]WJZ16640.1 Rhomboid protease GluP [Corynebacterium guangdongense]
MRTFLNHAPVTAALASVSVIVWLITAFQSGSMTNSTLGSPLADAMMFWGPYVMSSDYGVLRAITASFLHLDAAHVTMNIVMLLLVGWFTERHLGHGVFALTYLAGGVASYAAVLWAAPLTPTAGASGALYALMVILVAVLARQGQDLRAPLVLVAVNVGYTLLVPGVSLWGHLGGLLLGVLLAWPVTSRMPMFRWAAAICGLSLALVVFVWQSAALHI